MGLALRYPPNWTCVAQTQMPQYAGLYLYPPGAGPNIPGPLISFDFTPQQPYSNQPTPASNVSSPQPIVVAGITGRQYQDTQYAIPAQRFYIQLPWHGGTLVIAATEGPYVNLVPQLQAILATIMSQP